MHGRHAMRDAHGHLGPTPPGRPRAPPRPTQSLRAESSISKSRDETIARRPHPLSTIPSSRASTAAGVVAGLPRAAHTARRRRTHVRRTRARRDARRRPDVRRKRKKFIHAACVGFQVDTLVVTSRYTETEGTGSVTACADNCARFTFLNNTTTKFSVSGASRSEGQHYFGAFGARCRRRSAPPLSPCSARGSAALVQRSAARPPYY